MNVGWLTTVVGLAFRAYSPGGVTDFSDFIWIGASGASG